MDIYIYIFLDENVSENGCIYIYIYIYMQTVLFRPSGPHQCSADAEMKVKL